MEKGAVAAMIKACQGHVELTFYDGRVIAHGGALGVDQLRGKFANGGNSGGNNQPRNKPMMKTKDFFGSAPPPTTGTPARAGGGGGHSGKPQERGSGRHETDQHGYIHVQNDSDEEAPPVHLHDEAGSDHEHEHDDDTGQQVRVLTVMPPAKAAARKQVLAGMFGSSEQPAAGPKKSRSVVFNETLPEHEYDSEHEFV